MSTKPSYLGLLNAVSNGETHAARYFNAWLRLTTDPEVRAVVRMVANREGEHGLAFEKRLIELGYALIERPFLMMRPAKPVQKPDTLPMPVRQAA